MTKPLSALIPFVLFLFFSFTSVLSQSIKIDSLKSQLTSAPDSLKLILYLQITKAYGVKNAEMQALLEVTQKEAELEKSSLENKLQEQQFNEANFQLIAILLISIITVGFVITFYFLRSKRLIAEREAQELQVEALKNRLFELQLKNEETEKIIDITQINRTLNSPLTENEMEVLQLSLKGLPNSEIAERLLVSISILKINLRNVYKKLGASGKKEVFNYVAKSS